MKRVLPLLLALLLSACVADQRRQTAICTLEARNKGFSFQRGTAAERSVIVTSEGDAYIELCMAAAGYAMDFSDRRCNISLNSDLPERHYCYSPTSYVDYFRYKLERSLFE
ncbi:hypothetical protein V5F32_01560 [Xanthobacter oligotrophicus]|uniref:Lipoprotein n=1 Tax=Xanthobacter oligotrophicus TaxID=2607286 RepID=A0ABW6ZQ37_9HYPH